MSRFELNYEIVTDETLLLEKLAIRLSTILGKIKENPGLSEDCRIYEELVHIRRAIGHLLSSLSGKTYIRGTVIHENGRRYSIEDWKALAAQKASMILGNQEMAYRVAVIIRERSNRATTKESSIRGTVLAKATATKSPAHLSKEYLTNGIGYYSGHLPIPDRFFHTSKKD